MRKIFRKPKLIKLVRRPSINSSSATVVSISQFPGADQGPSSVLYNVTELLQILQVSA